MDGIFYTAVAERIDSRKCLQFGCFRIDARIRNFAYSEFRPWSALHDGWIRYVNNDEQIWASLLACHCYMIVIGTLGVLLERLVFYPLRDAPPLHDKIAAIGILLFLEAFAQFVWGADYQTMPTPYGKVVNLFGLTLTAQRLLIITSTIAIMVLLYFFLKKTFIGATIIAMSQNREGANLVGININKVAMMTFMISGSLAALAASLASPINLVFPGMGHLVILKAFVIIILGGMGSVPGAIIGGYILGFSESLGATYISNDYKDIIAFVILVIILTIKPTGLFVRRGQS